MKIKKIIYSLILSLVVFPSVAFGQWTSSSGGSSGYTEAGGAGLPSGTIYSIILNVMNWLLVLLGIIGVIGFVLSGIFYLTAAGDEDRMKMGKNSMKWSIMGIIVGLIGYVIIKAVDTMLGGTSPTF